MMTWEVIVVFAPALVAFCGTVFGYKYLRRGGRRVSHIITEGLREEPLPKPRDLNQLLDDFDRRIGED